MRKSCSFAVGALCCLSASVVRAAPSVLIAASDPTQIAEVELAKVVASDGSLWLSVKLAGHAKLAVVTGAASVEPAKAADAWLRALDFATRVRVTPPPGPLAACLNSNGNLADSGVPELANLASSQVSSVASELELRRSLAAAGLDVDLGTIAQFSAGVSAPFRLVSYEVPDEGGSTAAVRLSDSGEALAVPGIVTAGRASLPLTLLTLAASAVLPATAPVSDPSEFAVRYIGASAGTDYAAARGAWLAEDQTRWLLEARASSALFAWTVIPGAGEIEPALAHYFDEAPEPGDARSCLSAVRAARARASRAIPDYDCDGADDLGRSLSELDFSDIRVTRLFGSITVAGVGLRASSDPERDSRVVATDFDSKDCAVGVSVSPGPGGSTVPGGVSSPSDGSSASGSTVVSSSEESTTVSDGDSCTVTTVGDSCSGDSSSDSSSSDSCSGNSSSNSSSSDSCSGNSSSDSSSSDSCSGNSSSDSSSSDSCSGNSSSDSSSSDSCSGDSSSQSSSSDSSGCGKSNYDGDTCSGSSSSSASAGGQPSAALEPGQRPLSAHRARRVRLSLWTLLALALALPLRRWKSPRAAASP
jgi:hypothetical protein